MCNPFHPRIAIPIRNVDGDAYKSGLQALAAAHALLDLPRRALQGFQVVRLIELALETRVC